MKAKFKVGDKVVYGYDVGIIKEVGKSSRHGRWYDIKQSIFLCSTTENELLPYKKEYDTILKDYQKLRDIAGRLYYHIGDFPGFNNFIETLCFDSCINFANHKANIKKLKNILKEYKKLNDHSFLWQKYEE